eukprot:TRINITY_DN5612_c0_g2_i1.p1 TRINITY_DN5612_c0_g2~~TRINITY_DN5612_c0_g2_i1.p1  ORF type:complete len:657 (-),score=79.04 TRINITY_DN5612_c0_g2_i1:376-2325(-)
MGNETSAQSWFRSGASATQDASAGSKKGLLSKWQKRHLEVPLFGVVRHAERADGVYAFFEGGRWTESEDYFMWPLDPPLSDAGHTEAAGLGDHIHDFAKRKGSVFHVIISSPYLRCVQTAVKICQKQGPGVKILLDYSMGEVYGPSVMGEVQPQRLLRSFDEAKSYCLSHGVDCVSCAIGEQPTWPETLKNARTRFAFRFLSYLRRASIAKRNFLLVTHGDCIGTVMGILPDQKRSAVTRVDYGAAILASRASKYGSSACLRTLPADAKLSNVDSSAGSYSSVLPMNSDSKDVGLGPISTEPLSHILLQELRESLPGLSEVVSTDQRWGSSTDRAKQDAVLAPIEGAWHSPSPKRRHSDISVSEIPKRKEELSAMRGWSCETLNLEFSQKFSSSSKFVKRLNQFLQSGHYNRDKIEQLLGELGDLPFGAGSIQCPEVQRSRSRHSTAHVSLSTCLFGATDPEGLLDDGEASCPVARRSSTPSQGTLLEDHSNAQELDDLLETEGETLPFSSRACSPACAPPARASFGRKSAWNCSAGKASEERRTMQEAATNCGAIRKCSNSEQHEAKRAVTAGQRCDSKHALSFPAPHSGVLHPIAENPVKEFTSTTTSSIGNTLKKSASQTRVQHFNGLEQSSLMQRRKMTLVPINS